ncbi:hypothetical protein IK146_03030 [Candidatus Saccharibacteria bacterium]|nr:hypothetical protein [Candidatus Saccharibacteria bacterium]
MSKGSSVSNKPSVQPDLSPKRKTKFNSHEAFVAFVLVVLVVLAAIFLAGGFSNLREEGLAKEKAEVEALKEECNNKLAEFTKLAKKQAEREEELDKRESAVAAREKAVKEAQEDVQRQLAIIDSDRANLTAEEEDFYNRQSRIKELYGELLDELTLTNENE